MPTMMLSFESVNEAFERLAREFKGPMDEYTATVERFMSVTGWTLEEYVQRRLGNVIEAEFEVIS